MFFLRIINTDFKTDLRFQSWPLICLRVVLLRRIRRRYHWRRETS